MRKDCHEIMFPLLDRRLGELGHGDLIVVADGRFSATSDAKRSPIWIPGHPTIKIVKGLLTEVEPDSLDGAPAYMIKPNPSDRNEEPDDLQSRLEEFQALLHQVDREHSVQQVIRKQFHALAKKAELVIATNDPTPYACFAIRVAG